MKFDVTLKNEVVDSVIDTVNERMNTGVYGIFLLSWTAFHWEFLYSAFFVNEQNIYLTTGLLRNEYLVRSFFDITSLYFWVSWLMPIAITMLVIWKLPEWVLLPAFRQEEKYRVAKINTRLEVEMGIVSRETKLIEEKEKKLEAEERVIGKQKVVELANPTIGWDDDYERFKKLSFAHKFSKIIESYYKRRAEIVDTDDYNQVVFEIPEDILAYAHSNGIVEIDSNSNKIVMTDKGKYFISKFSEDPEKPVEFPF